MTWFSIPTALALLIACSGAVFAQEDERLQASWEVYQERHIRQTGRVVDDGNGGISHSEGQGYAMLLAAELGDAGVFARVWSWTLNNLMVRDDGLAAWRFDPDENPPIGDINNASDGDLLIAHALALAGEKWGRAEYVEQAQLLARTIREDLLREAGGYTLLLPGAEGFLDEQAYTVNPSYWIFHSIEKLQEVDPHPQWDALYDSGLRLLKAAAEEYDALPDWVGVTQEGELVQPEGFDWVSGYNALRIPLYLRLAQEEERTIFAAFAKQWGAAGALFPVVHDLADADEVEYNGDPAFSALRSLLNCEGLQELPLLSEESLYYPATLLLFSHLLRARGLAEC
ncbi:MAG TPA: glycosyl hydrolase family 8 [Kiloniellales bacterium]|nr:glycosyl hydrolase family 8 [Kiloniellales bacterium]